MPYNQEKWGNQQYQDQSWGNYYPNSWNGQFWGPYVGPNNFQGQFPNANWGMPSPPQRSRNVTPQNISRNAGVWQGAHVGPLNNNHMGVTNPQGNSTVATPVQAPQPFPNASSSVAAVLGYDPPNQGRSTRFGGARLCGYCKEQWLDSNHDWQYCEIRAAADAARMAMQ